MKLSTTALLFSAIVSGLAMPGWAYTTLEEDDTSGLVIDDEEGIVDANGIAAVEDEFFLSVQDIMEDEMVVENEEDQEAAIVATTKSQQLRGGSSSPRKKYTISLNYDKHSCLSFDWKDKNYYATMERCHHGDDTQKWYYRKGGYIESAHYKFKGWCLTYDTHHKNRYYRLTKCDAHKKNQRWTYNSHDQRIRSHYPDKYSCLDYCRDCGHYVHGRKCDYTYNKDQQYKFLY